MWFTTNRQLLKELQKMSLQLDNLEQEIHQNTDVVQSAIVLLGSLSQQIKDAGADPVKLQELTDALDANTANLAAAVAANTETPAPAPAPDEPAQG
jgi:hypothetical protein